MGNTKKRLFKDTSAQEALNTSPSKKAKQGAANGTTTLQSMIDRISPHFTSKQTIRLSTVDKKSESRTSANAQ